MKPKKKNKFFMFIFAFLPGACEMYMGFMKMGLSLMGVFFLSCVLCGMVDWNLLAVAFLLYFYAFFHARHLAVSSDEDFVTIADKPIWLEIFDGANSAKINKATKICTACAMIVIGFWALWNNFKGYISQFIPEGVWDYIWPLLNKMPGCVLAIILIVIGIVLIAGKKEKLDGEEK